MTRILVALGCLLVVPQVVAAQSDTTGLGLRLGFGQPALQLQQPAVLRAPWMGAPRSTPALRLAAFDSTMDAALATDRTVRAVGLRLATLYGTPFQAADSLEGEVPAERRNPLGLPSKYADLALDGQARLEIRTDRTREEQCTPALSVDPSSGCRGAFRTPSLDNQVNIRSTGVLGRRVHVNVDFDTEREYTSTNEFQVYYEGLQDEVVRRVDVGTVLFQPPASRFITAAVPANNFGVNAVFDFGPLQLQTLAATQKGSVMAERSYTIGQTTSQAQDRQARDLDFEAGRFFWVVDPDSVPGTPAVDILELDPATIPATYRPTEVRLYRYRAASGSSGVNPNLGGITASARRGDGQEPLAPVRWELLTQGTDYYVDDSGLWVVLATKLDQNDYLATSFRTAAGTTIGTFPQVDQGPGSNDVLELIAEPQQNQTRRTFRYEMRNVYRVAGADLDVTSLEVGITLNRSERPVTGSAQTYLQQLGLAVPNDPVVFDRENRLWPRARDPEASNVVNDRFIVFPHLEPFADPSKLSPREISDSLYRTPVYLLLTEGPTAKFALRLRYNASGGGDRSNFNLNALQIRDGSEQLYVGGRKLVRDVDYRISYDVGQVTFINPDELFGQGSVQVQARFEERGIFAVAPTTILGMSTRYALGDRSSINLIGLYQQEESAFNRPALGFEATANLIGGANTQLQFRPQGITRFLNSLTSSPTTAPSVLDVNAEIAFSKPDANRSGEAYLEEFESEAGLQIPMREAEWEFGSAPQEAVGLEDIGFSAFDPADAVQLVWQSLVPISPSDSRPIEIRPQDIDPFIRLAGRGELPEDVLYTTLHADTAGGVVQRNNTSRWSQPRRDLAPRWRSMVTGLSTTGLDLTRNEFLEFWALQPPGDSANLAGLRLVIDLGTVSEDAIALAPDTMTVNGADTVFTGRQLVGLGELDTERTDVGIFNAEVDDIGILGDRPPIFEVPGGPIGELELCSRTLDDGLLIFPWGDLSARCTRGNGALDTEDLDGDQLLNAAGSREDVFRYIVDLRRDDYHVRDGVDQRDAQGRTATWRLYRIPLRAPTDTIGSPSMRLVKHLRITFATPPDAADPDIVAKLAMARMRFLGSPWTRRSDTPILGLSGSVGEPHGEVSVSIVSTEDRDLDYRSPPGVADQVQTVGGDQQSGGSQINERSLRILGEDLRQGERAEAYLRFPAGPQNLLTYRTLRAWLRGPRSGMGGARSRGLRQAGQRRRQLLPVPGVRPDRLLGARGDHRPRDLAATAGGPGEPLARGRAAFGGGGVRHPEPRGVRRLRRALRGPPHRSRDQSTQSRLGAGAVRRHLPGRLRRDRAARRAVGGRHPPERSGVADRHRDVARHQAGRLGRGQPECRLYPAEQPVPSDQPGPDLPGHRRAPDDGQSPARSVPPHLVRAGDAAHGEPRPPERGPGAAHRNRSPGGSAHRPSQAGVLEHHLRLDAPTKSSGHQLGHQRLARPAGLHRGLHPRPRADRAVRRELQHLRARPDLPAQPASARLPAAARRARGHRAG